MKRKWIALAVALCLMIVLTACSGSANPAPSAAPTQTVNPDATFSGGSGRAEDPYLIATAEDLWLMAERINTKGDKVYCAASYKLTADIDLGGKEWAPMGVDDYGYTGFQGTLDGDGKTVSNFTVTYGGKDKDHVQNHGFIGYLNQGTVRNLTISEAAITAKGTKTLNVAAVVASARGAVVENCHTTGTVTVASDLDAAGVVCHVSGDCVVSGCSNAASVSGGLGELLTGCAAGIAVYADSPITGCVNTGTILSEQDDAAGIVHQISANVVDCENRGGVCGADSAAGIVCSFSDGALNSSMNDDSVTIEGCRNSGEIISLVRDAGGIASSVRTGHLVDCVNEGSVSAPQYAGGIFAYYQTDVFRQAPEEVTVTGCRNSGSIVCTDNTSAGGICGMIFGGKTRMVFASCENSGTVAAVGQRDILVPGSSAGGILGQATLVELKLTDCVNTGSVTGFQITGGILGEANPANVEGVTEFSLVLEDCHNSGKVYTVNPGGLSTELYAGGILGYTRPDSVANETLKQITDLRIEGCTNTGSLEGDTDGAPLRTHDLCASWNSDLK